MDFFERVKGILFPEYKQMVPSEREVEADRIREEQVVALRATLRNKQEVLMSKRDNIHNKVKDITEELRNTLENKVVSDD